MPGSSGGRPGTGPVLVDAAALQSPTSRGRGIGRYAELWALALERCRPDLVGCYLLDPTLPPPAAPEELVATGKLAYRGANPTVFAHARLVHSLSPLDLEIDTETVWPRQVERYGLRRTATVYDLIPALDPEHELADLAVRQRYLARLEVVRAADQLHVLSSAVRRDLRRVLGVGDERVVHIGAAPEPRFAPARRPEDLAEAGLLVGGLDRPFVLAPGGSHPRKNNERLLEAWGLLPRPLRAGHRLVVTGAVDEPTRHHYHHLAGTLGFADSLVVTGEVTDEAMLSLYRAALLVCFPSLAEGFGLPVAEAIACSTPVIASDRPPLDELLEPPARFDPTTPASIAMALAAVLGDEAALGAVARAARPVASPTEVAARTAEAFDRLLGDDPRSPSRAPRRVPRPARVALVSPFPPAPSGVAGYSYRLAEELLSTGKVSLDVYPDGPTPTQRPPSGTTVQRLEQLELIERVLGPYDAVCYALGNSHHHLGALEALRRRPGIVLAHDVRLTNCYRHEHGDPELPAGGFARAVRQLYPEPGMPERLGEHGELTPQELERYGVLMAREVIACSQAFLVSSSAAAALARLDARPEDARKIRVLPFAIEGPDASRSLFAEEGVRLEAPELRGEGPLLAHFGIVDPVKCPEVLIEAAALLLPRFPGLRLAFVGPVAAELAAGLERRAAALGCAEALVLTGPLGADAYRTALERATVAIQLRAGFNGEASAAVGECLASGVPTVVTRIGWVRSLPKGAVVALEPPVSGARLAKTLAELLADPSRRAALATAGRSEAEQRSFSLTAAALLDELLVERPAVVPAGSPA